MDEKVKIIISTFIKTPMDQLTNQTVIDRSAVGNSILLHRMYARLLEEGIVVEDYSQIRTLGDLNKQIGSLRLESENVFNSKTIENKGSNTEISFLKIGIDLEESTNLPVVADFRESSFYQQNFATEEISYCLLQHDPYLSFAGLFAAKEAIVKADNSYQVLLFNKIIIHHTIEGKPYHDEFHISIAHTSSYAVAVAISMQQPLALVLDNVEKLPSAIEINKVGKNWQWLVITALILSVVSLITSLRFFF